MNGWEKDALEIAILAARSAGTLQRARFAGPIRVEKKGAVDLVTEVDLACEEKIREILGKLAPGTSVLGEEGGKTGSENHTWIVDPLDGTTNFAHGVPLFCVSVAFETEGALAVGVVYDPMRDELFSAVAGRGAFLDGTPIRVTARPVLDECLLATGFAYDYRTSRRHNFDAFVAATRASQGVRRLGAAALDLAYVAAGRFDGFWELGLKPWDTAAGALLVGEAGGVVTGLDGAPYLHYNPDIIATNGLIHGPLIKILSESIP